MIEYPLTPFLAGLCWSTDREGISHERAQLAGQLHCIGWSLKWGPERGDGGDDSISCRLLTQLGLLSPFRASFVIRRTV